MDGITDRRYPTGERLVTFPRRPCADPSCRAVGRDGHLAHSRCRSERCLDFGVGHQEDHRTMAWTFDAAPSAGAAEAGGGG